MAKKSKKAASGKRRKKVRVTDLSSAKRVKGGVMNPTRDSLTFHK
jgi:hypothetical protein